MSESNEYLDLHLTVLAQWVVRRLGASVLVGALVGGIVVAIGVIADDPLTVAIGAALGPIVGAAYLATADAPLPPAAPGDGGGS